MQDDYCNEYDAFYRGSIKGQLERSFSKAELTIETQKAPIKTVVNATINVTVGFMSIYTDLKSLSQDNYPYLIVSAKEVLISGAPRTDLGFTWVDEFPAPPAPGESGSDSILFSALQYDEIERAISYDNNNFGYWSYVAVHELGHQRASLRHFHGPFSDLSYHYSEGIAGSGLTCVMHLTTDFVASGNRRVAIAECAFCGRRSDYEDEPRTNSCIRFLYESGEF